MISHGIPNHPYFAIAQPPSLSIPGPDDEGLRIIEMKDPKTGENTRAEFIDVWRFSIEELLPANAFCRLVYGIEAAKLVKVLCQRYPEIEKNQTVHFLLLKKL